MLYLSLFDRSAFSHTPRNGNLFMQHTTPTFGCREVTAVPHHTSLWAITPDPVMHYRRKKKKNLENVPPNAGTNGLCYHAAVLRLVRRNLYYNSKSDAVLSCCLLLLLVVFFPLRSPAGFAGGNGQERKREKGKKG